MPEGERAREMRRGGGKEREEGREESKLLILSGKTSNHTNPIAGSSWKRE